MHLLATGCEVATAAGAGTVAEEISGGGTGRDTIVSGGESFRLRTVRAWFSLGTVGALFSLEWYSYLGND